MPIQVGSRTAPDGALIRLVGARLAPLPTGAGYLLDLSGAGGGGAGSVSLHAVEHHAGGGDPLDLDSIAGVLDAGKLYGTASLDSAEIGSAIISSSGINLTAASSNALQLPSSYKLPVGNGGTGRTSFTAGDLLYYASGTALSVVGIGAANTILTSTGSAPQWTARLAKTQQQEQTAYLDASGPFTVLQQVTPAAAGGVMLRMSSTHPDAVADARTWSLRVDTTSGSTTNGQLRFVAEADAGATQAIALALGRTGVLAAQVGGVFGVVTPASLSAAAVLQADSTSKGFLPPRHTTAQRNGVAAPPTGLQLFNTDQGRPNYRQGTAWWGPVPQDDSNIMFLGDRLSVPGAASGGFYLSSSGGVPTFRTSGGKVITLDQGAGIVGPTGGATVDAEARTAITSIISALQARGFLA